jgi:hypothetical protein
MIRLNRRAIAIRPNRRSIAIGSRWRAIAIGPNRCTRSCSRMLRKRSADRIDGVAVAER